MNTRMNNVKKNFLTPKCGLDLLRIRTMQRDMLIEVTDQMTIENQTVNVLLDQIIEMVMHVKPNTDTRIILADTLLKIRELLEGESK